MTDSQDRPCPHCWPRGRDTAPLGEWRCHTRSVGNTPTRDSLRYPWGKLPDHADSGLYQNGPEDSLVSLYGMMTDTVGDEAIALDPEYGERLRDWQHKDARRNFVRWLAVHREAWGYVKLAIRLRCGEPEKVKEFKGWLESARRMREKAVADSKQEALRLARV